MSGVSFPRIFLAVAISLLLAGTVQVWAHGGVDDGDGGDDSPVPQGTPLQVLYPQVYTFEDSVSGAAAGKRPATESPAPASQTVTQTVSATATPAALSPSPEAMSEPAGQAAAP